MQISRVMDALSAEQGAPTGAACPSRTTAAPAAPRQGEGIACEGRAWSMLWAGFLVLFAFALVIGALSLLGRAVHALRVRRAG